MSLHLSDSLFAPAFCPVAAAIASLRRVASAPAPTVRAPFRTAVPAPAELAQRSGPRLQSVERDGCLRVWQADGRRVDCHSGQAWVTMDGDPRDIVLGAGESFVVDRAAPLLVFALDGPAVVAIGEPPAAVREAGRRRVRRRLAAAAASVAVALALTAATAVADAVLRSLDALADAVHLAG